MKKARIPIFGLLILSLAGALVASPGPQWEEPFLKGKKAYDQKDYVTAIANFGKAAAAAPENGNMQRWLGNAYYDNGQDREAIGAYQRAIKLLQGEGSEKECWLWMGAAQGRLGEWDAMSVSLTKCVELDPLNPQVFSMLSKAFTETKRYGEALAAAKRAVELDSSDALALKNLGIAYMNEKKYAEGSEALKKAIQIDANDGESHFWLGQIYFAKDEYAAALEAYQKSSALNPKGVDGVLYVAITDLSMGRNDDALAVINEAIARLTFSGIGISYAVASGGPIVNGVSANGPAEKAGIEAGDKIVRIGRKSTKGWNDIQLQEALRGAPGTEVLLTLAKGGASKTVEAAVIRESMVPPDAAGLFGLRSLANRYKGVPEAAFQDAEKAHSLNPKDEGACLSLAAAYLDSGRNEEAIKILSAAEAPYARLLEATAVFKQGKTQEAVEIFMAIPAGDMPTQNIMLSAERTALLKLFKPLADEHRAKARLFELKKQYPEALAELSEALRLADAADAGLLQDALFAIVRKNSSALTMPDEARKHALRGELEIKDGNFEQAAKEYRMAIRIAPYAARLYYNLALVHAETKNYGEAIRMMRTYLRAVPDAPDAQAAEDEITKWEYAQEKGKSGL
jgi:tetratricopeptide (TPR) repeat protein